jgi:hypothetical protein
MSLLAALLALAGAGLWLHRLFEGECLPLDLWDEWRLARADLADLDRRVAARSDRSHLVVSLTTIPSRLPHIADTLASLMRQSRPPALIVLNLPHHSKREDTGYAIPDWLAGLSLLRIQRCREWGPATKLIPTLDLCEPDQPIVVVDDDRLYPPDFLADLEAAAAVRPDAALGFSGWTAPADLTDRPTTILSNLLMRPPAPIRGTRLRRPRQVDILQGLSGYLVRPAQFERLTDYDGAPPAAFYVDDVWIAGHCRADKFVVPTRRLGFQAWRRRRFYRDTGLGLINRGDGTPERRNNSILLRHLAERWLVNRGK